MSHLGRQVWSVHMQGSGEAIFVPSGWHHTVENLQDTLSVNHKCARPQLRLLICRSCSGGFWCQMQLGPGVASDKSQCSISTAKTQMPWHVTLVCLRLHLSEVLL